METKTTNNPTIERIILSKSIGVKKYEFPYVLLAILSGLFFICWILALLNLLGISFESKNTTNVFNTQSNTQIPKNTFTNASIEETEKQEEEEGREVDFQNVGTWKGKTFSGDNCSYTLLKHITDGTFKLRENSTNTIFECTKRSIKNSTDYYFVDPDIADVNVNLACFNLKKGAIIYIIHNFDYDSIEQKSMDGILVPFSDNNVRIYLDMQINGTAYYCNNGNPPISRINENGVLEYYNSDGSNDPVYECYAKLH